MKNQKQITHSFSFPSGKADFEPRVSPALWSLSQGAPSPPQVGLDAVLGSISSSLSHPLPLTLNAFFLWAIVSHPFSIHSPLEKHF